MSATGFCLAISAILCVAAAVSYQRSVRKISSWRRTSGTVIDVKSEERADTEGDLQLMSASVVRFTTQGRSEITFQDPLWSVRPVHVVGQRVQVVYDPADPSCATLAGWRSHVAAICLAIAALVFLLIGLAES